MDEIRDGAFIQPEELSIRDAIGQDSKLGDRGVSDRVPNGIVMLTIDFDGKHGLMAKEVQPILADGVLSAKLES